MVTMLTTDDLARLRGLLAQHKQLTAIKDTMEYLSAYCKWDAAAGKFLADHGEELARVYAAVLGAPVGVVNTDDGDLVMVRLHDDEDRPDFTGKAVRLVPLGAGKGED